jgi:predicted PurR-regulated permease PerM
VATPTVATSERHNAANRGAFFLVAVVVAITLVGVSPLAGGLLAAPALAVICRPMHDRLGARVGSHAAALIVVIVVWVALVLPFVWLSVLASLQVPNALRQLQNTADRLHGTAAPIFGVSPDSLISHIGSTSIGWLSGAVGPALGTVGDGILGLSIALLGLYFLLVSNGAAWKHVRRHLPFSPEGGEELRHAFTRADKRTATHPNAVGGRVPWPF